MSVLRDKKSDHCREVVVVERFKQEVMYGCPSGQKEVAIVERWPLVEVQPYLDDSAHAPLLSWQ